MNVHTLFKSSSRALCVSLMTQVKGLKDTRHYFGDYSSKIHDNDHCGTIHQFSVTHSGAELATVDV